METIVHHAQGGARIVECADSISAPDQAGELVAACMEADAQLVLLEARSLPDAFFDLKTRFAGEFLQKLETYRIRVALAIPAEVTRNERFQEFLAEARRGRSLRVFDSRSEAEAWLAAG